LNYDELRRRIEKEIDEEYPNTPHHLKLVAVNRRFAGEMLKRANLKLSDLPHPKKCRKCGWGG